uniref:V-SNARE coiled-coil homology domain-containing protein n=1 Tax=Oncorhynchus tshawytscha TaxID=74940 RepID=A0AAZ3REG0_ONCTS
MPENNNQQRKVQEEAEEVKVIMMDNMEKTEERKEKVQDLDERAGELKSKSFHKTAMKVQKQMKCDNVKASWKLIAVVGAMAAIIIIVAIIMWVNKKSSPEITHERVITPMHENGITPTTNGPGM